MSQNPKTNNPGADTNRALDIVVNAIGVLAILLMVVAVIGTTQWGTTLKIPTSAVEPIRNAGWACIGLYILGSAWQSREWLGQVARRERTQSGANLIVQIVLSIAIVGALNYIGTRNHKRWDLTENKQFSLSEQTRKLLKDLPGEVRVTMFISPADRSNQQNKDLWQEYAYAQPDKVKFKAIDADRSPGEVMKFANSLPPDQQGKVIENGSIRLGTIILEYKGSVTAVTGYNEQDFTSALLKSTRSSQKTLYWVEGHGESDPDGFGPDGMGQVKQALEKQNYKIDKLPLFNRTDIPGDASVVVIAAPNKPFSPTEQEMLTAYIKRGGKVLVLLRNDAETGLEKWLSANYSVTPDKDIVLEDPAYTVGTPLFPAMVKFPWHSITQSFQNSRTATVFPFARSFKVADTKPEGVVVEPLAETSDKAEGRSYAGQKPGDSDVQRPFDASKDLKGPLKVAVAITVTSKNPVAPSPVATGTVTPEAPKELKGRVVAIGSAFFAGNGLSQRFANGDFFLASMNWLAEEEALISIPPKSQETRTVELVGRQQAYLGLGTVAFPPLALLLIGGIVWWRRR